MREILNVTTSLFFKISRDSAVKCGLTRTNLFIGIFPSFLLATAAFSQYIERGFDKLKDIKGMLGYLYLKYQSVTPRNVDYLVTTPDALLLPSCYCAFALLIMNDDGSNNYIKHEN